MLENRRLEYRVYDGPSLVAPFPAVVAEISNPFVAPVAATKIENHLVGALPESFVKSIQLPTGDVAFEQAVCLLTTPLRNLAGASELPVEIQDADTGTPRIAIGFHDRLTAIVAFKSALEIAQALFATEADGADRKSAMTAIYQQTAKLLQGLLCRILLPN